MKEGAVRGDDVEVDHGLCRGIIKHKRQGKRSQTSSKIWNSSPKKQKGYGAKLVTLDLIAEFLGWLMGLEPTTTGITIPMLKSI